MITEPFLVTREEYWGIMWMVFNIAWFHIASEIFAAPHERVVEDDSGDY